jgi:hypothetical protein
VAQRPELDGLFEIHGRAPAVADDYYTAELDDCPIVSTSAANNRCPECGARSSKDCDHDDPEHEDSRQRERETIEERCGVEFEGWDSRAEWR